MNFLSYVTIERARANGRSRGLLYPLVPFCRTAWQELSLVSWRLVLVDLLMMLYLLALFAVTLAMGINVNTNVVINVLFKCVTFL